ncbi:unnamed protein product [Angiostrongylus costaricensis]|uniref:Uncharacterized protein n=1 Tax=Angiostrongylus costaricensis TaxID=334426 RepID=A0A0R3PU61_ANGCS|nr:unnamed protein product [Angiostrongylus costaricensis]
MFGHGFADARNSFHSMHAYQLERFQGETSLGDFRIFSFHSANGKMLNEPIGFLFSVIKNDYRAKRRACLRGNDTQLRPIYIQHKRSGMNAEWEIRGRVRKLDETSATRLLSYLDVVALRIDVLKKGPRLIARRVDERLAHAITFCEEMCGNADLKNFLLAMCSAWARRSLSELIPLGYHFVAPLEMAICRAKSRDSLVPWSLLLCSQNPYFAWCMGEESLKRLSSFRNLESLVLENMIDSEVLDSIKEAVDLGKLRSIQMRLDAKHQSEVENMLFVHIQGRLFTS